MERVSFGHVGVLGEQLIQPVEQGLKVAAVFDSLRKLIAQLLKRFGDRLPIGG